jgi:hypothetical protein
MRGDSAAALFKRKPENKQTDQGDCGARAGAGVRRSRRAAYRLCGSFFNAVTEEERNVDISYEQGIEATAAGG